MATDKRDIPLAWDEDLTEGAQPSKALEEFERELDKQARDKLLDEVELRRMEDWGAVAHQVVGGEERDE